LILNTEIEPVPSSRAMVRDAKWEDYAAITALRARNGLISKSREEWEHLWINNPLYKTLPNWTIGWVAENTDRKVVGYVGNIPLSFEFKGQTVIGASIHGLTTDAGYQDSAGSLLTRLLNYTIPQIIVTPTANAKTIKLNGSAGLARVPTGDWNRSAYWIAGYQGFLANALKNKGWPKILSYPAAAVLDLRDRLTKADSWTRRSRREIETCSSFDERFDRFWVELKRTYPERLLATRSREVLQWHFKHALAQRRVWIVTAGDGSRLIAYAIFCRQDDPQQGLTKVRLVDFQGLTSDMEVLAAMLGWGLSQCRKEGIHMLEASGFRPEKQSVIDWLAPYRQRFPARGYFYKTVDKQFGPELQDPAVWDPSHFDGDATL